LQKSNPQLSQGGTVKKTVTLPVVWTPEANEDLLEARAWYDNIRTELGERFALAVEVPLKLFDHWVGGAAPRRFR
jgi:hypothetical protein